MNIDPPRGCIYKGQGLHVYTVLIFKIILIKTYSFTGTCINYFTTTTIVCLQNKSPNEEQRAPSLFSAQFLVRY